MTFSDLYRQLFVLIFGSDRKRQIRVTRTLTAAFVYVACIGLQAYAASSGFMETSSAWYLSSLCAFNVIVFYVIVRTGWSERFKDPSLTLPQVLAALTTIVYAYAVAGRIHGSIMMLLTLVQVFGIFTLDLKSARFASLYSLVLMGLTMAYKTISEPDLYPYQLEIAHFILIAAILPTISSLSAQLTSMRNRLQSQKNELAQALTRIQVLATRDELTGLYNRRHMLEVLGQHQKRLTRSGYHRFCLALIDIDHFKRINDTHGHGIGDEVLKEFAYTLQRAMRDTDVLARWGGEEFLLLINDTSPELASFGLERAREMLASEVLLQNMPSLKVTFSAGITGYLEGEALSACIERADVALYRAKAEGRNRNVIGATTHTQEGSSDKTEVATAH